MAASSAADVAKRMQQVGEACRKAQVISIQRAAMAMKAAHTEALMGDAPGGKLRNVGKKGAKLSVSYKIKGSTADPSAIVEAKGPWQILNNPAKAHLITGRKGTTLHFGDQFRRTVNHPGHKGKFTWQKAEPAAEKAGMHELNKHMTTTIQQAFKGVGGKDHGMVRRTGHREE